MGGYRERDGYRGRESSPGGYRRGGGGGGGYRDDGYGEGGIGTVGGRGRGAPPGVAPGAPARS